MKFKALCFFVAVLFLINTTAQNLVPNPSFEDYSECPTTLDGMHYVDHWFKSILYPGVPYFENPSPDYFNECAEGTSLGVPENFPGNQFAFDGSAYAGLLTYINNSPETREVMGVNLINSLIPGVEYFCSMRYVRASGAPSGWASNNIGMKFSNTEIFQSDNEVIDNFAHFNIDEVVVNDSIWNLLYGSFIPNESFNYLHIGNFFNASQTQVEMIGELPFAVYGYYFIDEVRVSTEPLPIYTGLDLNYSSNSDLGIYPNPAKEIIYIECFNCIGAFEIYSNIGKLCISGLLLNVNLNTINIDVLGNGVYIVKVIDNNGVIHYKRFIKN